MLWQDCVCVIAPYPNNPSPPEDFDPRSDMDISGQGLMWYARPQLFFKCSVCPTGQRANKHRHIELSLVFFSTFELINITPNSVMQRNGVPMLYVSGKQQQRAQSLHLQGQQCFGTCSSDAMLCCRKQAPDTASQHWQSPRGGRRQPSRCWQRQQTL